MGEITGCSSPIKVEINPTIVAGGYPTNPVQGFEMVNYNQQPEANVRKLSAKLSHCGMKLQAKLRQGSYAERIQSPPCRGKTELHVKLVPSFKQAKLKL